jgi:predicted O-methyltransferase YrrM
MAFGSIMHDQQLRVPPAHAQIAAESQQLGFDMPSDPLTGALLRSLAATRPGGQLLELGTGTGLATAWLLEGMDGHARLISVDNARDVQDVARRALAADPRVSFLCTDGDRYLRELDPELRFDLIFADTWPGKYRLLDDALAHLAVGGLYVIDDMLPQPNWPPGHELKADALLALLHERPDLVVTELAWSTGLVLAVKRAGSHAGSGGGPSRPAV